MNVLVIGSEPDDDRPTLPPAPLQSELDEEMYDFITSRRNPRDRVLIVDDDHAIVEALADTLLHAGFNVDTAVGGREGLLKLLTGPEPDVILLDWMMPDISGDVVHDVLKKSDAFRHIPILFISAQQQAFRDLGAMHDEGRIFLQEGTRGDKIAAARARRTGTIPPTSAVPKPFDTEKLIETVHNAVKRKGTPTTR